MAPITAPRDHGYVARGSIRERTPGSWELRVYAGMEDGRRRYATRTIKGSRKDAERALTTLQHEVNTGATKAPVRGTVADHLVEWMQVNDMAPSTRVTVSSIMDRHLIPAIGHIKLTHLTTADVDRLYAALRRKGLAPATIHRVHQTLRSALETARRWKMISYNPAADANPGPVHRRAIKPVAPADVTQVLKVDMAPAMGRYLRLAAATGARPGELVGLQVGDIDEGQLHIRRRVIRGKGGPTVMDLTKNGRERTISIGAATQAVLREQIAYMTELHEYMGLPFGPKSFLFSDKPDVGPWDPSLPSKRFRRAAKVVGIHGRLYDIRHGAVTSLIGAGVDLTTVSRRVGHARVSTTVDYYSGVVPGADEAAAALGEGFLNP